ncbi:MAG TPA: hypothetical protein VN776_10070 [Terracidiphilus sp.]|nr:hypothetical protein [Terracidiphilus sp.]
MNSISANPLSLRHARFHLAWQAISYAFLPVTEIAFIPTWGPFRDQGFDQAAKLASIPMLICLAAFAWRKLYGGALSDPNGIPPVRVMAFGSERRIDQNLATEVVPFLMLVAIVALFIH